MSIVQSTGNISKVSSICTSNNPPNVPSNPIPYDGALDMSICPPNLSWTGGDPDGDNVTYDVYFGVTYPPPLIAQGINVNWYQIPFLLDFLKTYYWMVDAEDEHGLKTSGPTWYFKTEENFPPYEPSKPYPEDGAKYVPVNVTLCWVGGDPNECDNVTYDVYFDDAHPPYKRASNQTKNCWKPPYDLSLLKTYYWRVVAWDSGGLSTAGPVWHFSTDPPNPPNKPTITGPTSGKVGVEYQYSFSLSDPDNDSMYLRVDWGSGTPGPWYGLYDSDTTVRLNHTWTKKRTYTIRAQAKDIHGITGPWGTLEVTMPKSKMSYNPLLLRLLERFPILQKVLLYLIK